MQHDEVIWQVIRHNHCSFMSKIETGIFCRNPYNVTGTCNRSSCPLANSRYATIREQDGVFYLYMKTIERAHAPNKMWERVKLPRNYAMALEIIDKHLMYWPQLLVHKTKQRLTKLTQMRIRMRKLALKTREKIMTLPTKEKKREARREDKAWKAALLERNVAKELLERLNKGIYPYNPIIEYEKEQEELMKKCKEVFPEDEIEDEEEPVKEYVEYEEEEDDMEDFQPPGTRDYDEDDDELDDDDDADDDEEDEEQTVFVHSKRGRNDSARKVEKVERPSKLKKKVKVHVEIEQEDATERQKAVH